MRWFSRKPKSGPLWDHLTAMTPERSAALLENKVKTADDSTKFLEQMIFTIFQTCGGLFLKTVGEFARNSLGKVNPEVIAFEALAFCVYLVREYHMPTSTDWEEDDENEILVESYRYAISAMPHLVNRLSGWEITELWERRIMYWFTRKSMKEATEAFVGTLLTMTDALAPAQNYGRMSLDMKLSLELSAHVHSFAVTMPKAMAEGVQSAIVEYGLID